MEYINKIKKASEYVESKVGFQPEIGIILGSGLGGMAEKIENKTIVKYEDIPGFPISTVVGHAGQLVFGDLAGRKVVAMQGRFHYYEGYKLEDVVMPVRLMNMLGIKDLIVTNAAGGVDKTYKPGDLMLITDHINFTGKNPLRGKNLDDLGPRFLDMSSAYNKDHMDLTKEVAKDLNIDLKEGVYMWLTGPTYETPAEVRMARVLGADAVGMSTVPEVIIANHEGVRVLGISCITNMAAGILDEALDHEDVVKTSLKVKESFEALVEAVISRL